MPPYNELAFYLQFTINITLLTGFALFLRRGKHARKLLFIFLLGELLSELSDLIFRLMKFNTVNIYLYPLSQSFGLLMMTEIYNTYFFKIPPLLRWMIYLFTGTSFFLSVTGISSSSSVTLYSNIITDVIICGFAAVYFLYVFKNPGIDKNLLTVNVFIFLFFSIESIISTTFDFLIHHHLQWVAPVWLFRGVLLWLFYLAFINLGWNTGKMKV